MKCDVCGSDNLEGAAYCEDCGAKLVVAHAVAAAPAGGGAAAVPLPAPVPAPAPMPAPGPTAGGQRCPSCGAENPDTELYCVDCGANLGGAAAVPAPEAAAPALPPEPVTPAPVPVAAPAGRLVLVTTSREFPLDQEVTTLGRRSPADQIEPDIDLTDDDPESYVSRRHAQVLHNDDHYLYEDVGSSNGSFINNARVQPGVQTPLKDGDKVRVGKTEFLFHLSHEQ